MTARELGNPMLLLVLMKSYDPLRQGALKFCVMTQSANLLLVRINKTAPAQSILRHEFTLARRPLRGFRPMSAARAS
ncbi:MAG: hypothetical protein ACJ79B_10710, partial [Gemmatimonadaceae bacterium]